MGSTKKLRGIKGETIKLNLKKYISRGDNIFVLIILALTVVWGFVGIAHEPWKNWEVAAVFLTFIYSCWLFANGFWIKRNFKGLPIGKTGVIVLSIIFLGIVSYSLAFNQYDRWKIMLLLFIAAMLCSITDYLLGNESKNNPTFNGFNKLFYYSDLPITIAFGILFGYSLKMHGNEIMDPFFSGAIAFQMILSNFLWSFFDDKVFEN